MNIWHISPKTKVVLPCNHNILIVFGNLTSMQYYFLVYNLNLHCPNNVLYSFTFPESKPEPHSAFDHNGDAFNLYQHVGFCGIDFYIYIYLFYLFFFKVGSVPSMEPNTGLELMIWKIET